MRVRFITQPYEGGLDLRQFLGQSLADPGFSRFDAAVAWAKRSGFRLVEQQLREFRARGGHVRLVIGISEGGATAQGLEIAAELATEAFVFHVGGRTFHSKVYAFSGTERASILTGSHNLTRGGSVENFEAGTLVGLELASPDDRAYLASVRSYIDDLVADTAVCRRLDSVTVAELVRNPRYRVADEDSRRATSDSSQGSDETPAGLFGRSRHRLRTAEGVDRPRPAGSAAVRAAAPANSPSRSGSSVPSSAAGNEAPRVLHRWFKKLLRADAQRLPGNSSPSGHITLTQAKHPIDQANYFRRSFFGQARWQPVSSGRERASIDADVVIRGRSLGSISLQIDHNPAFESGQGNRATTVRWGPLNDYVRHQVDVTDQWVTLEALSDGRYRVDVGPNPTGPFIP